MNSVYYAEHSDFGVPAIIKIMRNRHPDTREIARFFNEYTLCKDVLPASFRNVLKKEMVDNRHALVFEYIPGKTLRNLFAGKQAPLDAFFKIAISLSKDLAMLHDKGVIHKDIKSSNVIVNNDFSQVRIIDFSLAAQVDLITQNLGNPLTLEGSLPYISPEQTGRMSRVIDYRSDLYSLGVTFYELLTGRMPFESSNPLELIHCHLAKNPQAPLDHRPDLPGHLSDLVLKLMAKNPEDRYNSAAGLMFDLELCRSAWKSKKSPSFELGREDVSSTFHISSKLYGREPQLEVLLRTFNRTSEGNCELVLVTGYSGVGKSALVNEVHKPLTGRNGWFIAGKYDQYQRGVPYFAFTQAFQQLCRYLLAEPLEELEIWKHKILDKLGLNASVLTDLIPFLEKIIGRQAPVEAVGAQETINRFNYVFQNFLRLFCRPEHPLIIFLDDLQWADTASLKLLEVLMSDTRTTHLLIIGAYRDNEVDQSHPLMRTIDEIGRGQLPISQIKLTELEETHVNQLLADTLHHDEKDTVSLSKAAYRKTNGNPFFTIQFLRSLHEDNLVRFDKRNRKWSWDVDEIEARDITDNVVVLMTAKLNQLPEHTLEVLTIAACMGGNFDLLLVSEVAERSASNVLADLWPAIEEGLILPLDDGYKELKMSADLPVVAEAGVNGNYPFCFLHDRVQQVAYSLIEEEKRPAFHLEIGRLMAPDMEAVKDEQLYDVVRQFNAGRQHIQETRELLSLVRLNVRAGKKAQEATAYSLFTQHMQIAKELLPEKSFEDYPETAFLVYLELARSKSLEGFFEEADEIYHLLLRHASDEQKMEVYFIQTEQYQVQARFSEALAVEIQGLASLGYAIPDTEEAVEALLKEDLSKIPKLLGKREIAGLIDAPMMTDPKHKLAMRLLAGMWTTAYLLSKMNLVTWCTVEMTNLSLEHGNSDISAFGYVNYAFYEGSVMGNYGRGYEYGKLGVALSEKFPN
ncbi:MAG: serine/threonine-protein kinase PknK, partial [Acidobacteriota bacterium]|nr:serine/threonine-protein kinase PknK [Acidobacteriota bacterium]